MSDTISYTHWAYFPNEESAEACAREMGDYHTRIDPPIPESNGFLLRAGRDVDIDNLPSRHTEVEAIVTRHGGVYDYGEATYMDLPEGLTSVPDPALSGES